MGVASCTRTRTLQYNMVAQTTLVVFTIVLAATGVFVPEAGRELEEKDDLLSAQNVLDGEQSGHFVKRDAARDNTAGAGKGKKKRSKKNKAPKGKKRKAKKGSKRTSKGKKTTASKRKKGRRNSVKKSKKKKSGKGVKKSKKRRA